MLLQQKKNTVILLNEINERATRELFTFVFAVVIYENDDAQNSVYFSSRTNVEEEEDEEEEA